MKFTIPMPPKPQSRPRFGRNGAYEQKEMTEYKKRFGYFVLANFQGKPYEKPLSLNIVFFVVPPNKIKSIKKNQLLLEKEQLPCPSRPDLDNYIKSTLDALNGLVWKDDNIIAELHASKVYSYNPRTELEVEHYVIEENNTMSINKRRQEK